MSAATDGVFSAEQRPQNVRARTVGRVFAALSALVASFVAWRFAHALVALGRSAWEPWTHVALFAVIAFAGTVGPGLYLWSRMDVDPDNPFLTPVFIVATSLGFTMSVSWILYLSGCFMDLAAPLVFLESALVVMALPGTVPKIRRLVSRATVSPCEFAAFSLSILFCEGLFECVAGTPLTAWDAVVSWDKWASDIAVRAGLGGYVSGAYPPGIPLLVGLFYKCRFLLSGAVDPVSAEHLLVTGFHQVFPLLLSLSLIAVSRRLKTNALWSVLVFFGCGSAVLQVVKYIGYVDVPLAAFMLAALAVIVCLRADDGCRLYVCKVSSTDEEGRENFVSETCIRSFGFRFAALFFALFPVAFAKGNGFAALALATLAVTFFPSLRLGTCRGKVDLSAAWTAIVLASVFFLHQWIVGVWTDSGESDPFNHSLAVMASHADLVDPTFAHLRGVVKRLCSAYGFGGGPADVAFAVFVFAGLTVPLALRRTRLPAVFALILAALWFFTGSYDERNMLPVVAAEAVLFPFCFEEVFRARRRVRVVVLCAVLAFCMHSAWKTYVPRVTAACFRSYAPQSDIAASPEMRARRLMKLAPGGYEYFTSSPAAERSGRIVVFSEGYRYLRGKGVYPFQMNAFNGLAPHDLAVRSRGGDEALFTPKHPFVPISELNGCKSLGGRLYVCEPVSERARFEIAESGGGKVISVPVGAGVPTCGFVSVTFDGPADGVVLSLDSPDSLAGTVLASFSDGDVARLAYWVAAGSSSLCFGLRAPPELEIVDVEVGY